MNEHQRLERHHPIPSLAEALGDGDNAGTHVSSGIRGEVEDLPQVLLVGGIVVVTSGLDDQNFEVRRYVAGDFGYADAGLVFDGSDCFFDGAGSHEWW